MNGLVLNCGSSSLKFQLFLMPEEVLIMGCKAEKIPVGDTSFVFKAPKREWDQNSNGKILFMISVC